MNTFLKENSDFIQRTALTSSIAKDNIEKVRFKLASDARIAYDYMRQFPNFLSKVEHGLADKKITEEMMKDLSKFSGGNEDVAKEYLNDKEFIRSLIDINKGMSEVHEHTEIIEKSFEEAGYPIDQKGVVNIIHKLETGAYEPMDDNFGKILENDFRKLERTNEFELLESMNRLAHEGQEKIEESFTIIETLSGNEHLYRDYYLEMQINGDVEELVRNGDASFETALENELAFHETDHYTGHQLEIINPLRDAQKNFHEIQLKTPETIERFQQQGFNTEQYEFKVIMENLKNGSYPRQSNEFENAIRQDLNQVERSEGLKQRYQLDQEVRDITEKDTVPMLEAIQDKVSEKNRQSYEIMSELSEKFSPHDIEFKQAKQMIAFAKQGKFQSEEQIQNMIIKQVGLKRTPFDNKASLLDKGFTDSLNRLNGTSNQLNELFEVAEQRLTKERYLNVEEVLEPIKKDSLEIGDKIEDKLKGLPRLMDLRSEVTELQKENSNLKKENEVSQPKVKEFEMER